MEIKIKALELQNFKGIKKLKVDFNTEGITNIFGENASGKSTIFDAFCYLLTEKDSFGRASFNIKTLKPDGTPYNKLTHSVKGVLLNDGREVSLHREYKEKWTKKRGNPEPEFTGHETNHFVDGIPVTKKEYEDTVGRIIPEYALKLITNPFYFPSLKWEEKRKLVLSIAGEPELKDVAKGSKELEGLLREINNADFVLWKRKIKSDIRDKKKEIADIEPRINELSNSLEPIEGRDKIEADIEMLEQAMRDVTNKIHSKQAAYNDKYNKLKELRGNVVALENQLDTCTRLDREEEIKKANQLSNEIAALQKQKREAEAAYEEHKYNLAAIEHNIEKHSAIRQTFLADYKELKAKVFNINPDDEICYACGQSLPNAQEVIETKKAEFEENKLKKLKVIEVQGKNTKETLNELKADYNFTKNKVDQGIDTSGIDTQITDKENLYSKLSNAENYVPSEETKEVIKKLSEARKEAEQYNIVEENTDELKAEYQHLDKQRSEAIENLSVYKQQDEVKRRISVLEAQERDIAQEIAKLEKLEYLSDKLMKKKIDIMDKSIKKKFNGVNFKMYNQLINGGEEPTCDILIDGVPFDNANHAAKINTGIKLINSFSDHFHINAPIFVDNAEAVNTLEQTTSQVIRLVVVEPDFLYPDFEDNHGTVLNPLN